MSREAEILAIELDDAKKNARNKGGGMLIALTIVIAAQLALSFFGVMYQEMSSDERLGVQVYLGIYVLIAAIASGFAWFKISRIAFVVALLLLLLNWTDFILLMLDGEFRSPGWINLIGPFFVGYGLYQAIRYHRLKKRETSLGDADVFA